MHTYLAVEAWPGRYASPVNIIVMILILVSLTADVLRTEERLGHWTPGFEALEIIVLVVFTGEYLLRAWSCVERERYSGVTGRLRYLVSFYALIDLVAILPSYFYMLGVDLTWLRAARLFRILKFARFGAFSVAVETLVDVFQNRRYELLVSLVLMVLLIILSATGIYVAEAGAQPDAFGSIPRAMWWAVATLTTVGYGDVAPISAAGKTLAAFVSLLGIALVAIPTGILAASFSEIVQDRKERKG